MKKYTLLCEHSHRLGNQVIFLGCPLDASFRQQYFPSSSSEIKPLGWAAGSIRVPAIRPVCSNAATLTDPYEN